MNFDLNTENYKLEEFIQIFELPPNFDRNMVEIKEAKLRESILKNNQINKDTQEKTINFIVKAKNIILDGAQSLYSQDSPFEQKLEQLYNTSYQLKPTNLEDQGEHMVQVRHKKPYLTSFPTEFVTGVINPLKKRTIKKNLNIDSRFRENYYTSSASNYNITLPINMNNVVQMQLSAIEIPTTFYVVSKQYGNNYFSISVNGDTTVINIPDGNYNQITIMDAINNQLSLAGSPFNQVLFTVNIVNNNTGTGQTLVGFSDLSGNQSIELNFQADRSGLDDKNTPLPLKFGWLLGFRNGIYVNNLNYVSEGVVDTTGPKYLYLVIDDYNNNVNNYFYSAFNSSILNNNIIARIALTSNTFSILQQNNSALITTPRDYFGPVDLKNLNIQLLDEYGRVIDLNNMDFSFCLTLSTIYDL
uniref:Uncharacterized protein n=1 Tax=viral metagenome TaxID=1070528 RepID=A0A6C0AR24_9ZZZZ